MPFKNLWNQQLFPIDISQDYGKKEESLFLLYSPFTDQALVASVKNIKEMEELIALPLGNHSNSPVLEETVKTLLERRNKKRVAQTTTSYRKSDSLSILPNNICNFSCSYCYSAKGRSGKKLTKEVLKSALDSFINQSRISNKTDLTISFLGGGEPMLSWDLVQFAIEYAEIKKEQECFKKIYYSLITNGSIIDEEKLSFLKKYNVVVTVSFEILERIQNMQRSNYHLVSSNIKKIIAYGIITKLRTTITPENVDLLLEIGKETKDHYPGIKALVLEYVTDNDSFESSEQAEEFFLKYAENLFHLCLFGEKNNITIDSSLKRNFNLLINRYCPGQLTLTPSGEISACSRVCDNRDPGYDDFICGKVYEEGLKINNRKIKKIVGMNVNSFLRCNTCFAKWNCGGGCTIQHFIYNDDMIEAQCKGVKKFIKIMLLDRLNELIYKDTGKTLEKVIDEIILN